MPMEGTRPTSRVRSIQARKTAAADRWGETEAASPAKRLATYRKTRRRRAASSQFSRSFQQ